MAKEQTIYLGPEEDLTNVRKRLENTKAGRIKLVIPPQTQMRSLVWWRLLRSHVRKLNLDMLIISSDLRIRALAKVAGFRVADSLESLPPDPPRPASRPVRSDRGGKASQSIFQIEDVPHDYQYELPIETVPYAGTGDQEDDEIDSQVDYYLARSIREAAQWAEADATPSASEKTGQSSSRPEHSRKIPPQSGLDDDPFGYMEDIHPTALPEQRASTFIHDIDQGVPDISDVYEGEVEDLGYTTSLAEKASLSNISSKIVNSKEQRFGNYQLIRLLGKGLFTTVYLCENIHKKSKVAIKVLDKCDSLEEFLEEAQSLTDLKHPHVVRIQDYGVEAGKIPFLAMDYISLGNLRQHQPEGVPFPLSTVIDYTKQISSALQYLHDQNRIHGGIKPESILIGENNTLVLGDPINADDWYWQDRLTQDIDPIRWIYSAPEDLGKLDKSRQHPASDQYALGAVVYEWICGVAPFHFQSFEQLVNQKIGSSPPSIHEKNPTISSAIENVVMKSLAEKPGERFENVQAFAEALEQAYLHGHEGQLFGNYRLIQELKIGSVVEVYLGEHIQLGTKAVIKIPRNRVDEEKFQNGVRRIARLVHPNIVRILDFGLNDRTPYLVMDYATNGTLSERHSKQFSNDVPLPSTTIVDYVKQAADALQYAHDQNLILGDVSPENIFLGSGNEILLGGFDRLLADETKESVTPIGEYTAPEQISRKLLPASDQYALGVIVYELLSGEPPLIFKLSEDYNEKVRRLTGKPPPSLLARIPSLPSAVEGIVLKALAKDPKQRFESVQAFAEALEETISPRRASQAPKRVGQKFGNYRLIRLLGEGGFADVYLGKHIHMNTFAAVKILHTRLTNEDIEHFRSEARTLANLKHPHIVRVLDFNVENNTPFLVMDYAPNGTLRQRHPKRSILPLNTINSYVKQVANAIQYAHSQMLVHRDIKPENMLLGLNNEVLLSDFGIAVVAHSSESMNKQNDAGTVYYMAPEQIQGKPRRATDQYALAVVVYEWLSGTCPFNGTYSEIATQHITAPPPPLHEKNPAIQPAVEQIVMIALAKDPHQRFKSVQEFANALEKASKQ